MLSASPLPSEPSDDADAVSYIVNLSKKNKFRWISTSGNVKIKIRKYGKNKANSTKINWREVKFPENSC